MGILQKRKADRERLAALEAELVSLLERLERSDGEAAELRSQLHDVESTNQSLQHRLATLCAHGEDLADRVGEISDGVARLDTRTSDQNTRIGNLANDVAKVEVATSEVSDAVVRIDARLTGVGTELANQLTELGNELDALDLAHRDTHVNGNGAGAPDIDVDAIVVRLNDSVDEIVQEVLDEVESCTARLAAEQARYQIEFRRDLADMADHLRRHRAS